MRLGRARKLKTGVMKDRSFKVIPVVPYLIQNVTVELLNGPRRDVIKGRNVMRPKARGRQNATRECHADIDKERGVL